jgi:hypothetical protein
LVVLAVLAKGASTKQQKEMTIMKLYIKEIRESKGFR